MPNQSTIAIPTFLAKLGITHPILQAPMAGVSTPAMAAAVSNAGGLGALGLGAMNAQAAKEVIAATRALTDKPFNVNVFCHAPAKIDVAVSQAWLAYLAPTFQEFDVPVPSTLREIYQSFLVDTAMFEMLLAEKPAVISFHFGLPSSEQIAAFKTAGITLLATATSITEATAITEAGLDAIVAQGIEAGGHRGMFDPSAADSELPTLDLVRELKQVSHLPIIAAGGLMNGADIAQAFAVGADAVQLGTAFVTTPESAADAAYRAAFFQQPVLPTTLTKSISGRPARGFCNQLTALGEQPNAPTIPDYPLTYDAGKALHAAAKGKGNVAYAAQWAGMSAAKARNLSAATLINTLVEELIAAQAGN
ncbi:nitronate monooxygenase [Leeia sp. TBRC 13508]|uniref:Propionate 3-nitronate monooxygenase n=1 Tax=Leeia speluncae TaxID=2884804 RepID=A0ABS8D5Y5_9NEIS|nr:nitronate monooxygenase [Leeia speluncae]MCB6183033.1 nitronate monooxygenase [Leeia speluncae]